MKLFASTFYVAFMILSFASVASAQIAKRHFSVVRVYPHDPDAFTEGLIYIDGALYESTGLRGRSSIRKVDLESGKIQSTTSLSEQYFGEGLTDWRGSLVVLTWTSQTGFIFDQTTFQLMREFKYPGQGWGLTHNGSVLYMSDGTSVIRILDPETLQQTNTINVTADGTPLEGLNELEWINGEIYANVWKTNTIAEIDSLSGHVVGLLDMSNLLETSQLMQKPIHELNGIAYDSKNDHLLVTGKMWPVLFEIAIEPLH